VLAGGQFGCSHNLKSRKLKYYLGDVRKFNRA
jgi:hypothetical protein